MRIFPRRSKNKQREFNFSTSEFNPKIIGINFEQDIQRGIFASRISYFSFLIVVGSLIVQSALILFSVGKLPAKIPVFYSMPWGEEVLFAAWALWLIPLLNFLFALFDYLLINRMKADRFLSDSLAMLVMVICFICSYGTFKIITLLV